MYSVFQILDSPLVFMKINQGELKVGNKRNFLEMQQETGKSLADKR